MITLLHARIVTSKPGRKARWRTWWNSWTLMSSATLILVSDGFPHVVLPVICTTAESSAHLHPYHSTWKPPSGKRTENHPHSSLANMFHRTFSDYDSLKITTRSLHGHKRFTAWEWPSHVKKPKGLMGRSWRRKKVCRRSSSVAPWCGWITRIGSSWTMNMLIWGIHKRRSIDRIWLCNGG